MKFDLGVRCDYFLSLRDGEVNVERDQFLGVNLGKISLIAPWQASFRKRSKKFIDGSDMAVLPGLINCHTHLPMTLFRGMEDDAPLHQWLFEKIFPLEGKLVDRNFVRVGTELGALECIRFGTTTVNEMYFYAEEGMKVLDRAGLRGFVSQVFFSGPTPEDKDLGLDKAALFETLRKKCLKHPRLKLALGPHAPYTCNDDLLKKIGKLSSMHSANVHIHINESAQEVEDHHKKYGKTEIERLADLDVLSKRATLAHCVHMSEVEIGLLKKTGAGVVYNPDSNMKLGSGVAPVPQFLKAGISVGLGTDGAASNNDLSLFGAMDIGTKLQKVANSNNTAMVAREALRSATWLGAKALGLENEIGSLEVGKCADFIMVDLNHPHLQPVHNLVSQLVYAAQGLEVDTVVCDGKLLMKDKKFLTLKAGAIASDVEKIRAKMVKEGS